METTVRYAGGVKFEVSARGHRLICDQPVENRGEDAGMTPPELMLASLATCAGFYAVEYLKIRNLPLDGVTVRVVAEKATQPARLGAFRIEVNAQGATDERHVEGVRRAVEKCLIHNTLLHPPKIEVAINATLVPSA